MQRKTNTVKTLVEALPYIKKFNKEIMVIKYGGSAQSSPELKEKFAEAILLLYLVGVRPVIVHGGGKKISELLDSLNIPTQFIDGQRVTTPEVMHIVEMVLSGSINKEIVSMLNAHGAKAIGISGKDAHFLKAKPKEHAKWGLTGTITHVNANVVHNLIKDGFIPVIAPIASDEALGHAGYNINADLAASQIAKAIGAKKIVFLTDTPGVLDTQKNVLSTLNQEQIHEHIKSGVIHGGMLPKVDACLEAIQGGVEKAHIIDGRIEHSLLLELFTQEGIGTQIV